MRRTSVHSRPVPSAFSSPGLDYRRSRLPFVASDPALHEQQWPLQPPVTRHRLQLSIHAEGATKASPTMTTTEVALPRRLTNRPIGRASCISGARCDCQVFEEKRERPEPVGPDRANRLVSVSIRLASSAPRLTGSSAGSVRADRDRCAMRPLGIAAAAHQAAERLLRRCLERQHTRTGVLRRDEAGAAGRAGLVPLRVDMFE